MVATNPAIFAPALGRAAELARQDPDWLASARRRAAERFAALGVPGTHSEDWKYTDLPRLLAKSYEAASPGNLPQAKGLFEEGVRRSIVGGCRLVFVNGRLSRELSDVGEATGARVGTLQEAFATEPLVHEHLTHYADHESQPFAALNTATFDAGAFVHLPRGVKAAAPVHIVHIQTAGPRSILTNPRTLILAGEQSEAAVVETFLSAPGAPSLSNAVTEIAAGPEARLDHYKVVLDAETVSNVSRVDVVQDLGSRFTSHAALLGGAVVRNDVNVLFRGEGAECSLNGLFAPRGAQHMDTHTTIDHAVPRCTSREYYKGVLDGTSRGVFYGKIFVRKDAQKTNANQTNKNLLLSPGALVDSTPALEINADDVKCTHGSTIGQLDEDALFYLRSRGMEGPMARSLLTYAFARDVLDRMTLESVRSGLNDLLLERLPHGQAVREALQ